MSSSGGIALNRFNLNLFFALDAILNANTLTEAARATHLTQPAMSVSLKKLRGYFNDELVVYDNGETRLTALALALRPRIRQILQASREAMELSPTFDPSMDEGSIIISMPGVVELLLLPKLAAVVGREAPRTKLVSVPYQHETADRLFRQALDVAVVAEPLGAKRFAQTPLFTDTMCCLVWSGSAHGATMTEEQFFAARHVGIPQVSEGVTSQADAAFRTLAERQDVAVRASGYTALPHIVVGTELVAMTLTSYATQCAQTLPVRMVPCPIAIPPMRFIAQWQRYRQNEGILQWLVGKLTDASASLGTATN